MGGCNGACTDIRPRLLPENQAVAKAWSTHAETQWRTSASGLRTGLSYGSVLASMQAAQVKRPGRLFEGIKVIERALLGAQREWVKTHMESMRNG